jgi:mono/diheme cytochrome c family protein
MWVAHRRCWGRRSFASAWLIPLITIYGVTAIHAAQQSEASRSDVSSTSIIPAAGATSLIARGRYVALEADCNSCHTAPGGKPYAGGYPLKSPIGIIYGPNITQDVQTGIGSWTKTQFERALRLGRSKDGSYLYPAMPYEDYTKMTAADMDALWAYIRTIPPVKNTPPKNTLPFPFTVRTGLAVWQSLYFEPGVFVPDPHKNAEWNRGSYLVQVMGHCSQCHTPRNAAEALETRHQLGGADIEGWYAPDISGDTNSELRKWNVDQLAGFLKTGVTPNNAIAVGPMQETVHDSLSKMTTSDLKAIAVYLKDQPATTPVSPEKAKWTDERLRAGKNLYEDNCAGCHQSNGKGISGTVPALAGDGAVTGAEPYNVIMALLEGFAPQGTYGAMGSFAKVLNDEQIADVANYVRTAWGNSAIPNATPWGVSTWRNTAGTPHDEAHQMLCPDLTSDLMQPALQQGSAALKLAATDTAAMSKLVYDYRSTRPKASSAQVIEALSSAYCRFVSADNISESRMSVQIANFAQLVAVALGSGNPSRSIGHASGTG